MKARGQFYYHSVTERYLVTSIGFEAAVPKPCSATAGKFALSE